MPIGAIPRAQIDATRGPGFAAGERAPRLIVFSAQEFAWSAGFRGPGLTHHQAPWIFGWALGPNFDPLRSREWSEVIITDAAARLGSEWGAHRAYLAEAQHILRGMLRLEPMLWIQL